MTRFRASKAAAVSPSPTPFALTVDVEEWFTGAADAPDDVGRYPSRLDAPMELLLDVLDRAGARATFFFLGYLAERAPRWVAEVARRGHEIGIHGQYHTPLWALTPDALRQQADAARQAVLAAGANDVVGFRAPLFSLSRETLWAFDVLEDLGFAYSSSVFPIRNPRYGFPGAPRHPFRPTSSGRFLEFPISTVRIGGATLPFSGGFYLRVLPLALVRAALRRFRSSGSPAVVYLHPWELDPGQPTFPAGPLARVRHRVGLRTTRRKLEALLREFRFEALREIIWPRHEVTAQRAARL